ncbi:MAG: M42 family peptidase [Caldisericia bacterium]|nr:M42 family peptidase [Caldisericia bacterium]MDD4614361.1 M42 family peptidase [Caldisericia bacterium]
MFDWEKNLQQITDLYGLSGEESSVIQWIQKEIAPFVDESYVNTLGSFVAIKKGKGSQRAKLMISTHIDEIGFVVGAILENGFLRVEPRGGVDPKILQAQECFVRDIHNEMIPCVFSTVPPHLVKPEERTKVPSYDTLILDTGLEEKEVRKRIHVGSGIIFKSSFTKLLSDHYAGKTLDNRSCAVISMAVAHELMTVLHDWDVYFVFSSQEEVGTKGAGTSAWEIEPNVAIAMDVGFGSQNGHDGLPLGKGPGIGIGPNFTPKIVNDLRECADNKYIPFTLEPCARPGGTDAGSIQIVRSGIPTALLSLPLRYMHTPVEVLNLKDCKYIVELLTAYIKTLNDEYLEGLQWS